MGTRHFIAISFGLATLLPCLLGRSLAQPPTQDLYPLAKSKFGGESTLWIAEPGDTGLSRWDVRALFEEDGILLEWDSQKVVLVRPGAMKETTIPGDFVVRIEPAWFNESGEKIHRLFLDRQFQSVTKLGSDALKSGLPRWQQRLLITEIVESLSALGRTENACRVFAALAKENPPQLLLATIPIPWGEDNFVLAEGLESNAAAWMADDAEPMQLMGAAWLLSGSKRAIAIETLEQLAKNAKLPMVGVYARAQLWRTVPPAQVISDRFPKWIAERDKLILPAQAGPTMLLAERLMTAGQPSLAISEWLRIATLHADRYHLATKAIRKAVAALRSLGRAEEADRVQQWLERFKPAEAGKTVE